MGIRRAGVAVRSRVDLAKIAKEAVREAVKPGEKAEAAKRIGIAQQTFDAFYNDTKGRQPRAGFLSAMISDPAIGSRILKRLTETSTPDPKWGILAAHMQSFLDDFDAAAEIVVQLEALSQYHAADEIADILARAVDFAKPRKKKPRHLKATRKIDAESPS